MSELMSVRSRLLAKVSPEPNTGCWLWTGAVNKGGYGTLSVEGCTELAHRLMARCYGISIADGMEIDHRCRQRCCVNPAHLRQITSRTNTLLGRGPTAINASKLVCKRGHDLALAYREGSKRKCRACRAARMREYRVA